MVTGVRLFVAIYPPEPALDELAGAVRKLKLGSAAAEGTNVRLTVRPLWHVTVAFLGDVADERAPAAAAALQEGVARWGGAPLELNLAGGGRFGRGRFTVLWAGLAGEVAELHALGGEVRRALRRARLPCDRKPLRPHLTFARPGDRLSPDEIAADVAELAGFAGSRWRLERIHLVRSHLGPKPVHETLTAVPLG